MKKILIAALKSSGGTFINLISSAIAVKIIAVFSGPSGVGLFSLLRQMQQTASTAGAIGGQAVIVQALSGMENAEEQARHTGKLLRLVVVATSIVVIFLALFAPWLAPFLLPKVSDAPFIIRMLGFPVVLGSAVLLLCGLINSRRAIGVLALVQAASGLSLAIFAFAFSANATGIAFLFILGASSGTALITALWFCLRNGWLRFDKFRWREGIGTGEKATLKLGMATLMTGVMSMGSVLLVRALIIHHHGYAEAGIFDAAWTLSMTYVMLILSSFSAYYLPTLAQLGEDPANRNSLIIQYFKFATLSSIPLIAAVIVLKPLVIQILYSEKFLPAIAIMHWMLLGDFFKISAWVMAMPMVAYADVKPYLLSETAWNAAFVVCSFFLLAGGAPIEVVGKCFLALYAIYFLYTYGYCRRRFKLRIDHRWILIWVFGLLSLTMLDYIVAGIEPNVLRIPGM
jgi:PST family polysaccharide transporter